MIEHHLCTGIVYVVLVCVKSIHQAVIQACQELGFYKPWDALCKCLHNTRSYIQHALKLRYGSLTTITVRAPLSSMDCVLGRPVVVVERSRSYLKFVLWC